MLLLDAKTGIMGAMVSPLTGSSGNVEFLVHARKDAALEQALQGQTVQDQAQLGEVAALLTAAVSEADGLLPPGPPAG